MSKRTLSLFTFIDALGWEIVKDLPFLRDTVKIRQPLDTVFGYSATCDPTIITGCSPTEHGHFSFFVFDPENSPFKKLGMLSWLPKFIFERGRVRHWLSRFIKKAYGYTGYFQLYALPFDKAKYFDYTEKKDIYREGGILGGQPSIFVLMDRAGIPYFLSDWRQGEAQNLKDAAQAISTGEPRLVYLYLAAMDAVLHEEGKDSPTARKMIQQYEASLLELVELGRKHYDEVRLFVFSDHGMTQVIETCPLISTIEATGLVFGKDYGAVYDSTMVRFWFLTPGSEAAIRAALLKEPRGRILEQTTLKAWGADFPDRKYGELFFLLNPGVLLCPSFLGVKPLAGMHGYDPSHPDSVASFFSTVNLKKPPKGLADLFNLMKSEAGL